VKSICRSRKSAHFLDWNFILFWSFNKELPLYLLLSVVLRCVCFPIENRARTRMWFFLDIHTGTKKSDSTSVALAVFKFFFVDKKLAAFGESRRLVL